MRLLLLGVNSYIFPTPGLLWWNLYRVVWYVFRCMCVSMLSPDKSNKLLKSATLYMFTCSETSQRYVYLTMMLLMMCYFGYFAAMRIPNLCWVCAIVQKCETTLYYGFRNPRYDLRYCSVVPLVKRKKCFCVFRWLRVFKYCQLLSHTFLPKEYMDCCGGKCVNWIHRYFQWDSIS